MTSKILLIDDEPKIVELVRLYLERAGYQVLVARDGGSGLTTFHRDEPDLIVLDLMLPGIDGIEVCRRVRHESDVPIIMLTARAEEIDKLVGLEVGADDYVTKPFSPRELIARVRTVLRRSNGSRAAGSQRIEVNGLSIDATRHEVACHGKPIGLTPTEFRLLWALAGQPERVFSRSQLMDEALDETFEGYARTVDAHVKNLRRKLSSAAGKNCIVTVYGVGYRFTGAGHA
jgi:two-component system alkaline phosphatase synthesis response regulator PhoP